MKILKRPDNIIFDTEKPNVMEFNPIPNFLPQRLYEITQKSDFDFLYENFPPQNNIKHPVFKDFGTSYYYCLEV